MHYYKKSKIAVAVLTMIGSMNIAQVNAAEDVNKEKAEEQIEVIEVTGILSSLKESLAVKRNSDNIVDSIQAEDLGQFPDQNVAESLQRISGVAISRENGEGSKLTIRGFGPKYNVVQLNERTIATTDASRSLDFQLLPSELISGAEVSKTPMGKTPEGSIGAYVNIKTASPLAKPGFQAAGSIKAKYNDLSGDSSPKFSGIISNTFADDRFGVLLGFSHQKSSNRIDLVETKNWQTVSASKISGDIHNERGDVVTPDQLWYPKHFQFTLAEEERERTGANLTFEFAQTDDITHRIDYLYSDFSRQETKQGVQALMSTAGWQNVIASDAGTAIAGEKTGGPIKKGVSAPFDGQFGIRGSDTQTKAIGYNLSVYIDDFTFKFDVSHSTADANLGQDDLVPHYTNSADIGNASASNPTVFDMRDNNIVTYTTPIDFNDPANAKAHFNNVFHQELSDEISEVQFDASYEIDTGILVSIDTGISYFEREKIEDDYRIVQGTACRDKKDGAPKADWGPSTCNSLFDLPDDIFSVGTMNDYLSEESGTFPRQFLVLNDLDAYHDAIAGYREEPTWPNQVLDAGRSSATEEKRKSIFAQVNLAGDIGDYTWNGNVGLRYIETDIISRGHGVNRLTIEADVEEGTEYINSTFSEPHEITRENSYDNLLPSANFKLDINDNMVARFSGAKVISLPAITDINVKRTYGGLKPDTFNSKGGNPFLTPYEATQFDFTLEYYQDNGSAYAVNLFTKNIDTFISKRITTDPTPDIYVDGALQDSTVTLADGSTLSETLTQKENRSGGTIKGVEFAALHYFDYLPGFLSGFGLQANLTLLDSTNDTNIDDAALEVLDGITAPGIGLEGFSDTSYNIIAFYQKDKFQGRIAYNWRDDFLLKRNGIRRNNGEEGIPSHVKAYGQLDASFSYQISEHWKVSLAAVNLTNENLHEYLDIKERLGRIQYTGTRYTLGIRAKF